VNIASIRIRETGLPHEGGILVAHHLELPDGERVRDGDSVLRLFLTFSVLVLIAGRRAHQELSCGYYYHVRANIGAIAERSAGVMLRRTGCSTSGRGCRQY
jgi:hypothetical protein